MASPKVTFHNSPMSSPQILCLNSPKRKFSNPSMDKGEKMEKMDLEEVSEPIIKVPRKDSDKKATETSEDNKKTSISQSAPKISQMVPKTTAIAPKIIVEEES